jgi:hypothetical protein
MNYSKWIKITVLYTALLFAFIVVPNIFFDTFGVYSSLFDLNKGKKINYSMSASGINQRIYNTELILRNPDRFDSFLFGSSRIGVIDPGKITTGHFYNMSYPQGIVAEHLSIIKTFLKKGIKIKNVIIGMDEFSFKSRISEHENQLLYIMHPDVSGKSRSNLFFRYFFRLPRPFEISFWFKFLFKNNGEFKPLFNDTGLNVSWLATEKKIAATGKYSFLNEDFAYSPFIFDQQLANEVFAQIDEMKLLAKKNNFSLIIFFNPIYAQRYANYAAGFLSIKKDLAEHTDFYDFSGFNSITTDDFNYYEDHHYRYLIGDMIIQRISGNGNIKVPDDFGVLVTKNNVYTYINKQKMEMGKYLADKIAGKER